MENENFFQIPLKNYAERTTEIENGIREIHEKYTQHKVVDLPIRNNEYTVVLRVLRNKSVWPIALFVPSYAPVYRVLVLKTPESEILYAYTVRCAFPNDFSDSCRSLSPSVNDRLSPDVKELRELFSNDELVRIAERVASAVAYTKCLKNCGCNCGPGSFSFYVFEPRAIDEAILFSYLDYGGRWIPKVIYRPDKKCGIKAEELHVSDL